ncbi:MAG: 50S ribosomal protein L16 [Candidatus Aenigmarchaeota archaeon]|nr:50S ribosomal protein L16 [Candidatus Aenigmarchaeota archaeon]
MAKLRPARCYRVKKRSWTRQSKKRPKKGYVRGVPALKLKRFRTGQRLTYDHVFRIVSDSDIQVRDAALESARIAMSNYLQKNIKQEFYLVLRKYPFQVLREHKQAAVAGADRFFSGMRRAFGKPCGSAVMLKPGEVLFELRTNKKNGTVVKEAFRRAKAKMPGEYSLVAEELTLEMVKD